MMRKSATLAAVALFVCAGAASAQVGFGVGAHAGSTGVGGDVGVALTKMIGLHGSLGTYPVKPTMTFDELEFKVELPKTVMLVGVDLFPTGGSFHLMGGMMTGLKEIKFVGEYAGEPITVGDEEYEGDEVGTLTGKFETKKMAPFVGIGLGRHTGSGFGLTLDLGVAFLGKPKFNLDASGPIASDPDFRADLDQQEIEVRDAAEKYAKLFPILNIGIRIGM